MKDNSAVGGVALVLLIALFVFWRFDGTPVQKLLILAGVAIASGVVFLILRKRK